MPRPSWTGHLRLSLVTCPIALSPATSDSDRIRLNQINSATGNRIAMRTVDAVTGEEVNRKDIVKGYQFDKGRYVILDNDEIDAIQIESTKTLDMAMFVDRAAVNSLYLEQPYYIYPEGKTGLDAFRVIREALINKRKVAIGRIVISQREHPVMVEARGEGLLMWTLRTAAEVREAEYQLPDDKLNPEMVQLAETILDRFEGEWDPADFHDRYQEALRALIDTKVKGLPAEAPPPVEAPSNVIDLMAALKKSIAEDEEKAGKPAAGAKRAKRRLEPDRRQGSMLLPVKGGGDAKEKAAKPAKPAREREAAEIRAKRPARKAS